MSGKRILIAEDEPLIALDLRQVIEQAGYVAVGPAASVHDALAIIGSNPLDAALIDVRLGAETSTAVADELARLGVPFAFVTGYSDDAIPSAHRGRPLIRKPYLIAHILAQTHLLLGKS